MFRRHFALPQQHGSWSMWLLPYAVGIFTARTWHAGLLWLTLASLGAFLALQPATILVKALAGRRAAADRRPATAWLVVYGTLIVGGFIGMASSGLGYLLPLGVVAAAVTAWQMWLVFRHEERHNMWVEIAGAVVLAAAAPAGYWTASGAGAATTTGWMLWLLCGLQGAASIVYIYLRLVHRRLAGAPPWPQRWRMALPSNAAHLACLILAAGLRTAGLVPAGTLAAFALVTAEALYGGLLRPGVGAKPALIGARQAIVATAFAALLVAAY